MDEVFSLFKGYLNTQVNGGTILVAVLVMAAPRGGGDSEFQVTRMIEWGQKSKPKTIPRASNKTQKNPGTKN